MTNEQKQFVENMFKDMFQSNKPPTFDDIADSVKTFMNTVKQSNHSYNGSYSSSKKKREDFVPNSWDVEVEIQSEQPKDFDPKFMRWNAEQVYFIEQDGKPKVVSGSVPFDANVGFTKCYDVESSTLSTMMHFPASSITHIRTATDDEKELLSPSPSLEEAIEILRKSAASPRERRAFSIVLAALYKSFAEKNAPSAAVE